MNVHLLHASASHIKAWYIGVTEIKQDLHSAAAHAPCSLLAFMNAASMLAPGANRLPMYSMSTCRDQHRGRAAHQPRHAAVGSRVAERLSARLNERLSSSSSMLLLQPVLVFFSRVCAQHARQQAMQRLQHPSSQPQQSAGCDACAILNVLGTAGFLID